MNLTTVLLLTGHLSRVNDGRGLDSVAATGGAAYPGRPDRAPGSARMQPPLPHPATIPTSQCPYP